MRFWGYFSIFTIIVGLFYFRQLTDLAFINIAFPTLATFTILGIFFWSVKTYQDWFNPLTFLFGTAIVRLSLPALLLLTSGLPSQLSFSYALVPATYWYLGWTLAQIGLLSIALGWFITPHTLISKARNSTDSIAQRFSFNQPSVPFVAILFMLVGIIFVVIFLRTNYSDIGQALFSGTIRGAENRVAGTSRYNFIALWTLYTGSIVLSVHWLVVKRVKWWVGLLPVIVVLLILTPFGGRVNAFTPLVYAIVVIWYRENERKIDFLRSLLIIPVVALVFVVYAAFVLAFRGGGGLERGLQLLTVDGIGTYIAFSVWSEIGTLHPYTFAAFLGEGVMDGATYPLMGGFVTTVWLGQEGIPPGRFMVHQLLYDGFEWGYHTGLIIDVFMNTGLFAVMFVCVLFGIILRVAYDAFRYNEEKPLIMILYILFWWQSIWFFYESIAVVFSLIISLVFLSILVFIVELMSTSKFQLRVNKVYLPHVKNSTTSIISDVSNKNRD